MTNTQECDVTEIELDELIRELENEDGGDDAPPTPNGCGSHIAPYHR